MELKKTHPSILVGGALMRNRLVPHTHGVGKYLGGMSQEREVSAMHQAPLPRVPVSGR